MSRDGALWIGGLEPYMDEEYIQSAFVAMGENNILSIKIIKNKFTGEPASYGFVNFESDPAALMAMHRLNGKIMPNSQPPVRFKLNHNSTRLMPGERDYSVWVGDLTPDVDDYQFYKFFSARFQTVRSAKVVLDGAGYSKGYGFIRFANEQEQNTALMSMMGVSGLGGKPIKVSLAVPKWKMEQQAGEKGGSSGPHHHHQYHHSSHSNNTSSGTSITDNLPASALAMVVSNASGNPNAGAAMVAEAQSKEYAQMWEQYYQQQWEQYAAWNEYASQYAANPGEEDDGSGYYGNYPSQAEAANAMRRLQSDYSIFDGDEAELVEHSEVYDAELMNSEYLSRSEEFWGGMENSRWVQIEDMLGESERTNEEEDASKKI